MRRQEETALAKLRFGLDLHQALMEEVLESLGIHPSESSEDFANYLQCFKLPKEKMIKCIRYRMILLTI